MERPLELCEVLEEEHRTLYGREWAVTQSDISDAGKVAHRCLMLFPKRKYTTLEKELKLLYANRDGVARDLNTLLESSTPLIETHPNLPLSDEAKEDIQRGGT